MIPTLGTILDLTEQIQAALDAGDWQRGSDLDVERRAQLEQLVAEHGSGEAGGELQTALGALLARNQRLIGEIHHHRRRVLRDATLVKTGHSAVRAYDSTSTEV